MGHRLKLGAFLMGLTLATLPTLGVGCDDDGPGCTLGTEACNCTAEGTCQAGLTCASMKCVKPGGTGGTGGVGGVGGTGGTGGSGATGGAGGVGGTGGGGIDAGSEGGADIPPVVTDPDVICADVDKLCMRYNECAPLVVSVAFGTVARCIERLKLSCVDSVRAPGTGLTAATMHSCALALPGASCNDVLNNNVAACNFKGSRANGAPCGTDDQCMSGRCNTGGAACGTCADPVPNQGACAVDDDCAAGSICGDEDRCVAPAAGGAACSAAQLCRYDHSCAGGTCQASVTMAGAACGAGCSELHSLHCGASGTCVATPFTAPGTMCNASDTGLSLCAAGICLIPMGSDIGTCAALAADGQACGEMSDDDLDCQEPARCVSGRCQLPNSMACN